MKNTFSRYAPRVLRIAISLSLAVAAVCLMAACYGLYRADNFSPQEVAEAFRPIAIAVSLCLGLSLAGLLALPFLSEPPRQRSRDLVHTYGRLELRQDAAALPPEQRSALLRQGQRRRAYTLASLGLGALNAVWLAIYCANPHNFHTHDINATMLRAMAHLAPGWLIWGIWAAAAGYLRNRSLEASIEVLKKAPKLAQPLEPPALPHPKTSPVTAVVLVLAVGCMVYGLLAGGALDVLTKAVNICTECVGLG